MKRTISTAFIILLVSGALSATAQTGTKSAILASDPLTQTGKIEANGEISNYIIHYLPATSFPDLPRAIAGTVAAHGCLIPQTYEAHRPENVIRASLEHAGSEDWALLCSHEGTVALMVFFASSPEHPIVLASAPETERLQHHNSSQSFGFNWGIDRASPSQIHEAQIGLKRRPAAPDHDSLGDSIVDHKTIYHFYSKGKWTLVDLPE
jgi:hypothetical protein